MKKLIIAAVVVSCFGLSLPARADHHAVFVHGVQKLNSNSCAVELWITEDDQDEFEAVDRVTVDGVLLASFGDTFADAINDPSANNDTNDSILVASSSFESETGLSADVPISDAACSSFDAGADFSFLLDDPDFGGPNAVIDTLTASAAFGADNTAMAKSSPSDTPDFIDLDTETVEVANNSGSSVILGDSGSGGSGGCSLIR